MSAYYNERDPFAANWLRRLIDAGAIAPGTVDERDIRDVAPDDLSGFGQCHFFAGIGGWSLALRLAGWPDDRPVWTGSCPCQPFSAAGAGAGFDDERHLWPFWHHLVRFRRPAIIFGEQVASPLGLGWYDLVHSDMEGEGYALGGSDLCSAGVGAADIRQRLYWVAHTDGAISGQGHTADGIGDRPGLAQPRAGFGGVGRLADADRGECHRITGGEGGRRDRAQGGRQQGDCVAECSSEAGVAADTDVAVAGEGRPQRGGEFRWIERHSGHLPGHAGSAGAADSFWSDADWLLCRDGKWRPVEPGSFPLADGVSARVGLLRGYGNAINPWVAREFIAAFMDYANDIRGQGGAP
jgi:DNA (cytosine-5)-methyltransferase 1